METRLRNLLHDLATDMPLDVEGSKRRTLRRARGRRVVTAGVGVAVVVALVALSVSALRMVDPSTGQPALTGPNPAPAFQGLWPETDKEALDATQEAVDQGHMPLRTTPEGTATLLATNLLGWKLGDVEALGPEGSTGVVGSTGVAGSTGTDGSGTGVFVHVSNPSFDDVPPIIVELRQLGDTGSSGVWSVVDVSTPLIELDDVAAPRPEVSSSMPAALVVSGRVTDVFEGASAIEAHVFDGPSLVPSLGSARRELRDGRFDLRVSVVPTPDGEATMFLTVPDATGASLGATLVSIPTPLGETPATGPNLTGVPPDVAVTAQRIYDAAKAKDFDALAELLDPNTFVYNLDDGSDPIPAWRADPSVLDVMVAILEMAPTTRDIGGDYGTFTFWPYLVNSDLSALSPPEREDLASLGYSEREIQLMIDGGNGYQGPRLAIDETGTWRNFITVGE